jgi:hypothetical protein
MWRVASTHTVFNTCSSLISKTNATHMQSLDSSGNPTANSESLGLRDGAALLAAVAPRVQGTHPAHVALRVRPNSCRSVCSIVPQLL